MKIAIAVAVSLATQPVMAFAAPAAAPAAPDYSKYFYFYKAGVSADVATADYAECVGYGRNVRNIEPGVQNTYVPYYAGPNVSPMAGALGGAIGGAIGSLLVEALVKAPERRTMKRTILRKCMGFKGYGRYGTDQAAWDRMNDGDDEAAIAARFGAVASGAKPATEALAS